MGVQYNWPTSVLMVNPNGYRIEYAINPYMLDSEGNLQTVDSQKALDQWRNLHGVFTQMGLSVEVVNGDPEFPDMVYCANQTLPVVTAHGERVIVLSRMHSPVRRGEVAHLNNWAKKRGFATFSIVDCDFEGAGDAIWNYGTGEIFGGHGFRTDPKAYEILRDQFGLTIHPLKLVDANYYHLDTCFVVLGADTAAYLPKAFDQPSQEILRAQFPRLIEIDEAEARLCFAGNATAIGGHTVVLQKGSTHFQNHLREIGLKVIEVETGEFIKGGGSVFCMKQLLF